ncbi:MAG TPA: hypothetical protein PLO61_01475 [Fimbriimonadaceae bacterium]|nr:hypothetical protein [Fimbriimonadaceae bacterium]HRJ32199.1 hypothetical protein [Fimbriimonadaceae bacterium]
MGRFMVVLALMATVFFGYRTWSSAQQSPPRPQVPREWGTPGLIAEIPKSSEIQESSGLARSYRQPKTYFTHNDSGDSARFFQFDLTGKVLATYTISGASALDWEDMASARVQGQPLLFLGDIGDNAQKRASITVWVVSEPVAGADPNVKPQARLTLTYPDSAHNAETLLVHPKTQTLEIVTKTADGKSGVYRHIGPLTTGNYTLKRVGDVNYVGAFEAGRLTTGGDVSPEGDFVVIRTYLGGFEYAVPPNGEWWKSTPRRIQLAAEPQGEAIAYNLQGDQILTTSEGTPCPVSAVDRKARR